MASAASVAARSQLAREGIKSELDAFATRTGISVQYAPIVERDPALRAALEFEQIRAILAQVNQGLAEMAMSGPGSGVDPAILDGNISEVAAYVEGLDD